MANFGRSNNTSRSNLNNPVLSDLGKDISLQDPPKDSISDLQFRHQSDHLAVASWDNDLRIYDLEEAGRGKCVALIHHEGPVLNCSWSKDGQKVFGAGVDKAVRMLDLGAGTQISRQVAIHDQPIRCVESLNLNQSPMLVTGSWDKTVKYWDLRQQTPVATLKCEDRVYAMSARDDKLLVIGTADRWLHIVDLSNPTTFFKTIRSPLNWQTRAISAFKDGTGYAVGSVEGRCAFQYVEDKNESKNYTFRCHRSNPPSRRNVTNIYAVNAISVHPQHGTFSTAGSDGTFHFWDKDARTRLKGYPEVDGAITATDFNRTGEIFAYAVGYDWSKGYNFNTPQYPTKIVLHRVVDDECKPRTRPANR